MSAPEPPADIRIFIDADACPVKDEIYKVAARYRLHVFVVSNAFMLIPKDPAIERVIVEAGPDVADDWIAERASAGDIVVTNDIPLASRCLANNAQPVSPTGKRFTADMIGSALAGREIAEHMRSIGQVTRGPAPFGPADRSRFLGALDEAVHKGRRGRT